MNEEMKVVENTIEATKGSKAIIVLAALGVGSVVGATALGATKLGKFVKNKLSDRKAAVIEKSTSEEDHVNDEE